MQALQTLSRSLTQKSQHFTAASTRFSSSSSVITVENLPNNITHVQLNRPDKHNALSMRVFRDLTKIASELKTDTSIRAIILSGSGKSFCSGLDIKSVMKEPRNFATLLDKPSYTAQSNLAQEVGYLWRTLPCPVICAIHGLCFGGGLQIALGADFRYATETSKFSIMETKWGLIPDMGISVTLRELMSIDKAKELTFTGRIIDAPEALKCNLITEIVPNPFAKALELANEIVTKSPDAIAASKILYNETWANGSNDKKSLDLETTLQRKLVGSINQGIASGKNFGVSFVPFKNRQDFDEDVEKF